jgi:hypothetical protein
LVVQDNSIGGNYCSAPHSNSVEHYGSRRHLGSIFDDATFKMHDVADYTIITADRWVHRGCMNDRVVLNTRASSDHDFAIISPQDSTRPDCRFSTDLNIANNHCLGMHERSFMNLWNVVA